MKVTIAIPTNRSVKPQTVESLLNMVSNSKYQIHVVVADKGYTTAENRNYSVVQAQKNNSDYLLFIDDDMVFPPDTLDVLIGNYKDIVGVASMSRVLPLSPTVGMMDKDGKYMTPEFNPSWKMKLPDDPFKAYFVGGGVLLIDMEVFKKLNKPYFKFESNEDGKVIEGEDGYFCRKAREAGLDVWCDPTLPIGHIGDYNYAHEPEMIKPN
jgi:glycosyltransferase involved in cell wall biosynthesis